MEENKKTKVDKTKVEKIKNKKSKKVKKIQDPKKAEKNKAIIGVIAFVALLVAAYFLTNSTYKSYILPDSYKFVIYIVVVLIAWFATMLLLKSKANKLLEVLRVLFIVLLSVCLGIGAILIPEVEATIDNLQVEQPTEGTLTIDVISLIDTEFNGIADFANNEVGVQTSLDQENQEYAINFINLEASSEMLIKEYEDFETGLRALLSKEITYLLINESYISIMNETEEFANFTEKIKVDYQVTRSVAYDSIESDVRVTESSFNVLIIGQNQEGVEVSNNVLTDVVMVATVNPLTKQILLTSLPRDSYVDVDYSSVNDKLTHTGMRGTESVIKTVSNFLDINIDFYLRINYNSLISIIDALGGVSVYNDYEFRGAYPYYKYTFKQGEIYLNGDMALSYARERKDTKCGDMSRNKHQRQILEAMIDRVASPTILMQFNQVLKSLEGTYLTNISSNQIYSLMKMQLEDLADWDLFSVGVTGGTAMRTVASASQSQQYSVVLVSQTSLNAAKDSIATVYNATVSSSEVENEDGEIITEEVTEGGMTDDQESNNDLTQGC
ncbi:MAG: LCP family protein [Erysipelotrichaceae bacterium]